MFSDENNLRASAIAKERALQRARSLEGRVSGSLTVLEKAA